MASAWGAAFGTSWGSSWGVIQSERPAGGYEPRKKREKQFFDFPDRPNRIQVEAEKKRIEIVRTKAELKSVRNKRKDRDETESYDLHIALLEREIARLAAEYNLLLEQLRVRGDQIRGAAIYQAAVAELEKEESRKRRERDIVFLCGFLACS
jgi:hypothetical protein